MKVTIFHGSDHIIKKPVFGKGKKYNDYGLGFYCTEDVALASEWAVGNDHDGFANEYELDTSDLKILNLNDKNYSILNWLAILLENRIFAINVPLTIAAKDYLIKNFKPDYESYDVIIGYRADDSYFGYANSFIRGTINLDQLKKAMVLGKLGTQIVLKSEKAFKKLKYVKSTEALRKDYLKKKANRDENARKDYKDIVLKELDLKGIFIQDILREEMKSDDKRIR